VPYKGTAPAITDIIGGQITYTVETVAATLGHVKAGRLKAYGVSFAQRASAMPDVPTIAEAAPLPGYDIGAWIGYTAPAGMPREAVARLAAEMQKIAQAPDIKERYLTLGLDPISSTPEEMATFMRAQQDRYGSIIKAQNIRIE
jgi:tripartite-type tricarboxylate transporter receptor subunit TctC